jgi:catechol 2,3-dioxygenase-like lactoylglutathione lyase family enzyme
MITGITHITRYVPDYTRALEFYRDLLGMNVVMDNHMAGDRQRWLTVGAAAQPGVELVLQVPGDWLNGEALTDAEGVIGKQPALLLSTNDIEGIFGRLQQSGAKLNTPAIGTMPWGRDLSFEDPFGNAVYLVEPRG